MFSPRDRIIHPSVTIFETQAPRGSTIEELLDGAYWSKITVDNTIAGPRFSKYGGDSCNLHDATAAQMIRTITTVLYN